jgi:uncharacterized protein
VRRLRRIAAVLVGGYVVAMLVVMLLQRRLIYRAPAPVAVAAATDARMVRATTATGLPVVALYFPAVGDYATVVHFHGNAEQLADMVPLGRRLHRSGLGFFAVEYPGYGLASDAAATEDHLYAVAEAALKQLRDELHVPTERTIIEGHSLGSGVAAEMARRGHGGRLVLVAPFTSMVDMAKRAMPYFPVRWLVRDRYDTLAKAAEIRVPTMILHGGRDEIVPLEMGRRVAERIAGAKFVVDEEGGHNDLVGSDWHVEQVVGFAR